MDMKLDIYELQDKYCHVKHHRWDKSFREKEDDNKMFTSRGQDKTEINFLRCNTLEFLPV